jgi:hypothetical protein
MRSPGRTDIGLTKHGRFRRFVACVLIQSEVDALAQIGKRRINIDKTALHAVGIESAKYTLDDLSLRC